ncbi:MAG TPA: hypothetical protein PLQ52_11320 [Lacunisphaera sp.]|nr:hypothetical protein [Lacunisphaera sp.]HQY06643.1 hypothetical protein [Lacunisphaera sp.]
MTTRFAQLNQTPPAPEKESPDRSIAIGLGCTVLFHLLLVWLSPRFAFDKFSGVHSGITVTSANKGKSFDFELAQPPTTAKERDPFRFVETNSAAPDNTPDQTTNFSNRNQQSAQEVAATEKDPENRPSVKGQDKIKNDTAIVSGDMAPPQLPTAPNQEVAKDEAQDRTEQHARAEQVPLSGYDKTEGKSEDGIATNIADSKRPTNNAQQAHEGAPDAKDPTGGLVNVAATQRVQPKERPRLASASLNRSTILSNRAAGVTNIGIVGMDARWSEYGEYLNELIEIVQQSWYNILRESRVSPPRGSHVIVTFKINPKGETEIVKVEDADAGKQGVFSCQNAITYPQPYRKWTDQMIAVLGDSQELTFSFYYQ